MNKFHWLVIVLSAALSCCAPSDPEALRTDPGPSLTFEVNLPYSVIYANEQRGFLMCLTGSYYEMSFAIRPRIDTAEKSASVILIHHGMWTDIWAAVDMLANEQGTKVSAYTTGNLLMKDFPRVAEKWASGDFTCPNAGITTQQFPRSE